MKNMIWVFIALIILAVSLSAYAVQNNALLLEGDPESFFEAPDHDAFHNELGTEMTVDAWIYINNQVGERMILNKEDSWEFAVVDGVFQSALQPVGGAWAWMNSGIQIPQGQWTHVAVTWDGTNVRMYADGEEGNPSVKAGGALNATADTFKAGRRERGGDTHSIFDGLIDEVRISKVIRYDGDYVVPDEAFEPDGDTVALYHFDEETGGEIKDFSKNGVDGTLMGDAALVPSDAPTVSPVEARGKLVTRWGSIKASY